MSEPALDLTGKVALVTGAGTGIGRATAILYARHGADLILAGRKPAPLEDTADRIRALGRRATVIPTDVKDPQACEQLVERGTAAYGRLDVLLNNAGGSRAKSLDAWTLADYQDMIALNLTSVWVLSLAASRVMRRNGGGAIVNISSMASLRPIPHSAPYGAAKAAVNNLTAVMAVDMAPFGIRVNCIAVGVVKSEGFLRAMDKLKMEPDVVGGYNALGRAGTPEEIAWPALFLSTPASSFITGQTIMVSGGPQGWFPGEDMRPTPGPAP
ncbi:MAG: SDR family NAD(P)-dependent oxidoreductase [Gammaproteobacteria bacterium]